MKIRLALVALVILSACQSAPPMTMRTVPHVDLPRFMGPWYVIASIPTFLEKEAYGAVESYELRARRHYRHDIHLSQRRFRRRGKTHDTARLRA